MRRMSEIVGKEEGCKLIEGAIESEVNRSK